MTDSNFTQDERDEIETLAETRDNNKPRESSFSHGEDRSMEDTANTLRAETDATADLLRTETEERAANLGFNQKQQDDLAWRFRRRFLPVAGYIVLAAATAFSFSQERDHSNANRAAVQTATAQVLHDNCVKGNALRVVIRNILASEKPQIQLALKQGKLTPLEAQQDLAKSQQQINTVKISDCSTLTVPIQKAGSNH